MPLTGYAQNISDIQKTQAQLQAQEKTSKKQAEEKKRAEQKMKTVQQDLVETAKKSQSIERKLNELESKQTSMEQELSYLTGRLIEDQGLSTTMFRTIYQNTQIPVYGLYFSKMGKDQVLHRMIAMNRTLPSIHKRMQSLEGQISNIKSLQNEINTVIATQKSEMKRLETSTQKLSGLLSERKKLYAQAETSYAKSVKDYERLQKEAKNLEELVAKLRPSPKPAVVERTASRAVPPAPTQAPSITAGSNGHFLPVAGSVKINYGETDEIGGKNQGIIFTTQNQAVVVSPMAGQVVFAGPFQNYKRLLIIEHSGSYHSLVAGLDHIETEVGAKLAAGEPIGRIDRSNRQKGRLYYELRKDSKPVNPNSVLSIKNG